LSKLQTPSIVAIAGSESAFNNLTERIAADNNLESALLEMTVKQRTHVDTARVREQIYTSDIKRPIYEMHQIPKRNSEGLRCIYYTKSNEEMLLQLAICQVLSPIFDSSFMDSSYAFRPCRGPKLAVARMKELLESGEVWAVNFDIRNCFGEIPHQELISSIQQKVADSRLIELLSAIIKTGYYDRTVGIRVFPQKGILQGMILSPLLCNIYLDQFDSEWESQYSKIGTLIRYADDFVILTRSHDKALYAANAASQLLGSLSMSSKKKPAPANLREKSIDFLGFTHTVNVEQARQLPSVTAVNRITSRISQPISRRKLKKLRHSWLNYYGINDESTNIINTLVDMRLRLSTQ